MQNRELILTRGGQDNHGSNNDDQNGNHYELHSCGNDTKELKLKKYDTISIPPGVCRSFTNVGKIEGLLQVIISGGVHDMNDISFTPNAAKQMNDIETNLSNKFEKIGFKFTAGS